MTAPLPPMPGLRGTGPSMFATHVTGEAGTRRLARRGLLAAMLASAAAPVGAAVPRRLQLISGLPPMPVVARVLTTADHRKTFEFHATGRGAPAGRITVPSWYGGAHLEGVVRIAGRDLVLIAFEGNTGTGVFQELLLIAGVDNAGRLRILGIETLSSRENGDCALAETLAGRVQASPGGQALRVRYIGAGTRTNACPARPGGRRPWHENWQVVLPWTGEGVLPPATASGRIGSVARRLDNTRARTARWLAEAPRDVLSAEDMDRLSLYDTF